MDYDDAALEEMLHNAHREHVYHSQREGPSVGQSSSSVSERTVRSVAERTRRPVRPSGQELNTEYAQIRTLLDRQKEQVLAGCQAENKKHEFQADYDRRSTQKLRETIESQQEELHRAQAEELQRRDQQLLHAQLLQQNCELREAHDKSLNEMEELKKFQSSTVDTIARRRLVEDQDTILELIGKIQELQNEFNCMNDSRDFQDPESVRSGHSHVTSQLVSFPPVRDPGGMLSRSIGMPSRSLFQLMTGIALDIGSPRSLVTFVTVDNRLPYAFVQIILLKHGYCTFVIIRFRPYTRLFINLAMCI